MRNRHDQQVGPQRRDRRRSSGAMLLALDRGRVLDVRRAGQGRRTSRQGALDRRSVVAGRLESRAAGDRVRGRGGRRPLLLQGGERQVAIVDRKSAARRSGGCSTAGKAERILSEPTGCREASAGGPIGTPARARRAARKSTFTRRTSSWKTARTCSTTAGARWPVRRIAR